MISNALLGQKEISKLKICKMQDVHADKSTINNTVQGQLD